jgi:hypothetical protein
MIDKFKAYLDILPLTQVVKDRVNTVINLNSKIVEMNILDIFISNMNNDDGAKEYTSLWLFTDQFIVECKNFLSKNDFDITPHINRISYCSIAPIEFDFETVTDKSSVVIHCTMGNMSCQLIATDENCLEAFERYKKHLISNLIR